MNTILIFLVVLFVFFQGLTGFLILGSIVYTGNWADLDAVLTIHWICMFLIAVPVIVKLPGAISDLRLGNVDCTNLPDETTVAIKERQFQYYVSVFLLWGSFLLFLALIAFGLRWMINN